VVPVHRLLLRDLLPQYGIPSMAKLCQRTGLTKQHAWLLWHGTIALSADMMRRLHAALDIPLEALMQVERAVPAKPPGRKPRRSTRQSRPSTPRRKEEA
jgi:transcriptional regulator with XRE-family HTH domain